jgi:ribosome-associated protein
MTKEGVLVLRAERHRTQELNRAEVRERLAELVRRASVEPKRRIRTRPSQASKERRLERKARRGEIKRLRSAKLSLE